MDRNRRQYHTHTCTTRTASSGAVSDLAYPPSTLASPLAMYVCAQTRLDYKCMCCCFLFRCIYCYSLHVYVCCRSLPVCVCVLPVSDCLSVCVCRRFAPSTGCFVHRGALTPIETCANVYTFQLSCSTSLA